MKLRGKEVDFDVMFEEFTALVKANPARFMAWFADQRLVDLRDIVYDYMEQRDESCACSRCSRCLLSAGATPTEFMRP